MNPNVNLWNIDGINYNNVMYQNRTRNCDTCHGVYNPAVRLRQNLNQPNLNPRICDVCQNRLFRGHLPPQNGPIVFRANNNPPPRGGGHQYGDRQVPGNGNQFYRG